MKDLEDESFLSSVSVITTRFQALNDVGQIANIISNNNSFNAVKRLFRRWNLDTEMILSQNKSFTEKIVELFTESQMRRDVISRQFESSFDNQELVYSIREVAMKSLYNSSSFQTELIDLSLTSHRLSFCTFACYRGMPDIAFSALNRLRRIIELDNKSKYEINPSIVSMALVLEEAKVLMCKHDVTNAIRKAKSVLTFLQNISVNEGNQVTQNCIDLLQLETKIILCSWLTRYKMETGNMVLESFLTLTFFRFRRFRQSIFSR